MEATLSLQANLYPKITPAGAYYAVSSDTPISIIPSFSVLLPS